MMNTNSYISKELDDAYETCEECRCALLIYPNNFLVNDITNLLSLEPTVAKDKGQKWLTSRGQEKTTPISRWELSSQNIVKSRDLRRHLEWLLRQLEPKNTVLQKLQSVEGLSMYVQCTWWSKYGNGGPMIWPSQMKLLGELNLELGFELSFYDENDDVKS